MSATSVTPLDQATREPPSRTINNPPTSRRRIFVWFGVLALCAFLPYVNSLFNGFVYDDTSQLLANPYVQSFGYLREIFTTGVWSFAAAGAKYYRPIMSFGYLLCYEIFGRDPFGFHLFNVLLYVLVVCALFVLTERLFQNRRLAFWAAAIFALHPIHTESVAWIGGVTDLELAFFFLITFFLFLKSAQPDGGTSRRVQLAMLVTFALAAMSKEPALGLPLLATVYEHFFREDRQKTTLAQKISRYDLLWVAAAGYLVVRTRALGGFSPSQMWAELTRTQLLLSAVALFGQYIGKVLYPWHLCAFYVFHKSVSLLDWGVLAGGVALMTCAVLFAVLWRRAHNIAFGLIWFMVILLPVLNAHWVAENVFAERYLFLPSVGFCWIVAWGGLQLWKSLSSRPVAYRGTFVGFVILLAASCSLRIVTRNRDWHDDLTFYTQTVAFSPDAYQIRNNLADVYDGMGEEHDAEREWREVLRIQPNYPVTLGNLGVFYADHGRKSLGAEYLERAVKAYPGLADNRVKLGMMYTDMGQWSKAEEEFRAAIAAAPLNVRDYAGLAYLYSHKGDDVAAERALQKAEAINPSDSQVRSTLAAFYAKKGRSAEARREYEMALKLNPANSDASNGLRQLNSSAAR